MPIGKPPITIQWHITTNCNNNCSHCYMFDSKTFQQERKNTLNYNDLLRVLDSIDEFEEKWGADISQFAISGGDPLLRKEWPEFVRELKNRGKSVSILGNPDTLTKENLNKLAELEIDFFQMSLDGLEETHDTFRSKGSFLNTVSKIELLSKYGINPTIMFTLFPENKNDFIPLLNFVAKKTKATSFSFDLGCSIGNATNYFANFSPAEVKNIFNEFIAEKKQIISSGYQINISEKSHLLRLSHFHNEEYYPINTPEIPIIYGCPAGWHSVVILSDGTALACRRLLQTLGKIPEQSFEEIFLGSSLMKKLRRANSFEECGHCDFYKMCRGCPATSYGFNGNAFAKNPFCFKDPDSSVNHIDNCNSVPPINANFKEEFNLIAKSFYSRLNLELNDFLNNESFQNYFLDLAYNHDSRKRFLSNPKKYLLEKEENPDGFLLAILHHFFIELGGSALANGGITKKIADGILYKILKPMKF